MKGSADALRSADALHDFLGSHPEWKNPSKLASLAAATSDADLKALGLKLGARLKIQHSARPVLDVLKSISVVPRAVKETTMQNWQEQCDEEHCKLMSSMNERAAQAAAMVPNGVLVQRLQFALQQQRDPSVCDCIGCAELLLVRLPAPPPAKPPCRICMEADEEGSFDDDATLNGAVAVALGAAAPSDGSNEAGSVRFACGRLLRDACACRGSSAAVHEGCLAKWLIASNRWGEHICAECKQPYVGRASLVLARLHQRLKFIEAHAAAEHAAETMENGATPSEGAQAALQADMSALAELEARHNEAVNVWHAGRFMEAAQVFAGLLDALEGSAAAATAARAAATTEAESKARDGLNEARAHLELSACHNLGLTLHDAGQSLDTAASFISKASAGFELRLGPEHPNTLKCLHNVGMLTAAAGKLEEAANVYEQALLARRHALGADHQDTLKTQCNLGLTRHQLGDHQAAVHHLEVAEEHARRVLGPASPITLASAHNLGLSLVGLGQQADGVRKLRQVWQARCEALGATHRDTIQTVSDLGRTLAAGGEAAHRTEARSLLVNALDEARAQYGAGHPLPRRVEAALKTVEDLISCPEAGALDAAEAEHWMRGTQLEAGEQLIALLLHVFVAPEQVLEPIRQAVCQRALQGVLDAAWAAGATAVETTTLLPSEPLHDDGWEPVAEGQQRWRRTRPLGLQSLG